MDADDEDILEVDDTFEVVEALLDAKDKAYELGLALKLNAVEVKSICDHRKDPQDRLTGVIGYLLKQVKPKPTWKAIVTALRSRSVNEMRLAKRIEKVKIPLLVHPVLTSYAERREKESDARKRLVDQTQGKEKRVSEMGSSTIIHQLPSSNRNSTPHYLMMGIGVTALAVVFFLIVVSLKQQEDTSGGHVNPPESRSGARKTPSPENLGRLSEEPTIRELLLIKYRDSKGEENTFHLINKIQTKCPDLGLNLGIDDSTLEGLKQGHSHSSPSEMCKAIFQTWINRGEGVTWAGLIQALEDTQLGGISKHLQEALA